MSNITASIPENWEYHESLESLFFFYLTTKELLSDKTVDSYALPLHNTISLVYEMGQVFYWLKEFDMVSEYYNKYLIPIIEEFKEKTVCDDIFKDIVGMRLESIRTGFGEAIKDYRVFDKWINVVKQACSLNEYVKIHRDRICNLVKENSREKTKLLSLIKNYCIALQLLGYSREFMYKSVESFFNDKSKKIYLSEQISWFLNTFQTEEKKFEFLLLVNVSTIEYISNISEEKAFFQFEVLEKEEVEKLRLDPETTEFFNEYEYLINSTRKYEKIKIVRASNVALDPYRAIDNIIKFLDVLQMFRVYFIHSYSARQAYKFLLKSTDGKYVKFNLPRKLQKRPHMWGRLASIRMQSLINKRAMSSSVYSAVIRAINMHAEAISLKSHAMIVRTLWTALETLFLKPDIQGHRENVVDSMCSIIQKTYLLKMTRNLYYAICAEAKSKGKNAELTSIGINSYQFFLEYFASYDESSSEMKKIYAIFNHNPLLRWKIFTLRKELKDGEHILKYVKSHEQKIKWQLARLHRIRNIITHIGREPYGVQIAVNHLHNYFDYVINYMLCKIENDSLIMSIPALVFETQNDNRIHVELLKSNRPLSKETYVEYFFGPDKKLIDYKFL